MKRILAVLVAAAALVFPGLPALGAGGWAVTYLDPPPDRFDAGTSYTLGFWVLQHGSHPFEGKLDPVALRLTGEDGKQVEFPATALPEAAHYAAAVVVPEGHWKVEGIQGWFRPYPVGTLTVPGSLKIDPIPSELVKPVTDKDYWGAVRPPGFPMGKAVPAPDSLRQPGAPVGAAGPNTTAARPAVAAPASPARAGDSGFPAYALLIAGVVGAGVAVAALRLRRRAKGEPEVTSGAPAGDKAETIVISG
ncbi:hypothetical protein HII36_41440 [Nonomuraea sp. NN258]|uniref:hypothetical protein n=1 Tax=Nonomuraea antri TaxID=2730852 RepID=UPI00156A24F2|nr:hypothetical protein [Nonomuraea antri]NRQ38251.1 hypothetical protein [Nonomuraea antri]